MLLFFLSQLFFRSLCSPAQRPFTLFRNKDVVSDTCVVGWQLALKRRPIVDQPNGGQVASVGPLAPASAFNAERGGSFLPFQFHTMPQSVRIFQPECCVFVTLPFVSVLGSSVISIGIAYINFQKENTNFRLRF